MKTIRPYKNRIELLLFQRPKRQNSKPTLEPPRFFTRPRKRNVITENKPCFRPPADRLKGQGGGMRFVHSKDVYTRNVHLGTAPTYQPSLLPVPGGKCMNIRNHFAFPRQTNGHKQQNLTSVDSDIHATDT